MIRKSKLYVRPKKAFESQRIGEENELVKKYGLKNKTEVWKTLAKVNYYRKRAMDLANSSLEDQEVLFNKLRAIGLDVKTTADILGLKVEDLLERRLPTVVFKKGLANTVRHARQLVTHKKVIINGKITNSPSYIVPIAYEETIKIKESKKTKPSEPIKEKTEEVKEDKNSDAENTEEEN